MYYFKNFKTYWGMILFAIFAIYFVFFNTFHSINCIYKKCTTYKQIGLFGFKTQNYSFNRKDVASYEIGTRRHRSHLGRHSSYHTDYYPILIMQNGEIHNLPYKFCRNKYKAEEMALDIMSDRRVKQSEHPFGW